MMVLCSAAIARGKPAAGFDNFIIFGSGDYAAVCGTGTDAAFDSAEAIENMVKRWKAMGITGIIHRLDLPDLDQNLLVFHPLGNDHPEHRFLQKSIADVQAAVNQPQVLRAMAEKHGLEYWAWWPTVYSDGAPSTIPKDELGLDQTNWIHEHKYVVDHPEYLSIDRNGKKYYGVVEYAYPGARAWKIKEFEWFAREHGIKNFIACLRTEASQIQPPAFDADQYGFNQPVVDDMKRLYSVDIMTDPRFDVKSPDFKRDDPMVQHWRDLRGSYLTQFYRELREAMNAIDPNIKIGVQIPGETVGPPLGNWPTDWRTWVNDGLVELIIPGITLEATLDPDASKKGYFTDAIAGTGMVAGATYRDFIKQSKHPEVRLLQANGNYYFFNKPDPAYDGWRTDAWCLAFNISWAQRWQQWEKDIADFGHIRYIEQNFDEIPVRNEAYFGGFGDPRYSPALRRGTGIWTWLGNGESDKPFAQDEIRHGDTGHAMKITGGSSSTRALKGRHWSGRDRSMFIWSVNNAVANGTCDFTFWFYLQDEKSDLFASLHNLDHRNILCVRIGPGGAFSYYDGTRYVPAEGKAETGKWQQMTVHMDVDQQLYTVSCNGTEVLPPTRYETDNNSIGAVFFDPGSDAQSVFYIDDVAVNWQPQLYKLHGDPVAQISDDAESYKPQANIPTGNSPKEGVASPTAGKFRIETNMAFGDSYQCIRAAGGGTLVSAGLPVKSSKALVVEADVFLRSELGYIAMVPPKEGFKSANGTDVGLVDEKNNVVAAIKADPSSGTWQIWDGNAYVTGDAKVQFDCWTRVRFNIDLDAGTYDIILQPIGELPSKVATAKTGKALKAGDDVKIAITPTENPGHISCYDNLAIKGYTEIDSVSSR